MIYDFEGIGKKLQKARKEQGRKKDDIVEEIKIAGEYLDAIESGDLSSLPSQIYYNLFVRSYSKELGFDPDKFLEEFATEEKTSIAGKPAIEENKADTKFPERVNRPPGETSPLVITLWVSGVIIIVIAAIIWFSDSAQENNIDPVETDQVGTINADSVGIKSADALADALDKMAANNPEQINMDMEPAIDMIMNVRIKDFSWILVMADDDTVLNRNLDSGAVRNLSAKKKFVISLGNPKGVDIRMNSRVIRIPVRYDRPIIDFEINQNNFRQFWVNQEGE